MGKALWLFLYLALNTEQGRGCLIRDTKTISEDMGIKERTIREWLKILKARGYIGTRSTGRSLFIHMLSTNFKDRQENVVQSDKSLSGADTFLSSRGAESCQSDKASRGRNSAPLSQKKKKSSSGPIDISINKNIFNIDNIEDKKTSKSDLEAFRGFTPRTKEEVLALDLALALDDYKALPLYISYSKRYPETLLRSVLGQVKEIPPQEIKKSRGALFNYLIQKYDEQSKENPIH
ncbi:MAG: helix-turn-helix domain-containing protein [Deltaproteobacteria bacterium]|nr:helix-turn-helix domain-containing protein [Deltaproteobacteria bacterium]